ncbi:protein kinase [Psychromonas sp. psych-6C06]|uniref:bifunctional serine/threonine-protein kinase/formylglycine-generating enzyme family protein n=1 Tax=Psychromonas sp. psych-6C06 TaxID=2058089 RepID=UPI000C33A5B7|nr:bifunctional serine/threonine-protein kinase/formylglycine-generating enzyme family protein [Psychromonas sp. psych-6C06]PKF63497.1 protein kinase [Psychromonas sp. psych-6C06]
MSENDSQNKHTGGQNKSVVQDDNKTVFRKNTTQPGAVKSTTVDDQTVIANNITQPIRPRVQPSADDATRFQAPLKGDVTDATKIRSSSTQAPLQTERDDATQFRPTASRDDATQFRAPLGDTSSESVSAIDLLLNTPEADIQAPTSKMLKGRFVLEDVLGVGGMGIVYKAKDLLRVEAHDRDPYVAIKVLSEEFKTHPEAFISLQRESKKAQHIANQNTVKVYDFDRDGDVVFMTMEYMIGQPLDEMVKQYHATGLPRNETWNILHGMCAALIHAHSENIVHSDLKPGNVFVTDQGIAKIFDFGIARAVATIDRSNNEKDKTVFDAGNLGALTPAYASREMLLGQVPDVRDDIYALGCIAYEMLTGDHPFTRLPADEAYNKKLKPKRIQGIKKRHWKAIEAALAFKREDRIASVEVFFKQITEKKKTNMAAWLLFLSAVGASGYAYTELTKVEAPKISQEELMNQLEFKVRYELLQENINKLLADANFTERWQSSLWDEMQTVENLFPETPTPWYFEKKAIIYQLYIEQINGAIEGKNIALANNLISNAARYNDDLTLLDEYKLAIEQLVAEQAAKQQANKAKNAELEEANRLAAAEKKRKAAAAWKAKQAKLKAQQKVSSQKKQNLESYNVAMSNVEQQLTCTQRLNMRDFKIAIEKLRSLDFSRYQKSETNIIKDLASCISTVAETHPDSARDAKRYAMLLFTNNSTIEGIEISDIDGCQLSIAGLGARGSRAVCKDALKAGGTAPTMVVVPAGSKVKAFAIGKYEVTVGDYNHYCKKTKVCSSLSNVSKRLPKTNLSVAQISAYIKWLNSNTGKKYRLPTQAEWTYAAKANTGKLDSNRNCNISSRGIEKGKELINTTTGKQNKWGLVNYAGNAQELVYASGRKLMAVGGSYQTSMHECTSDTVEPHSGKADQYTGFRLARNIVGS